MLTTNALNTFKFKTTYYVNISKKLILVFRCSFLTKYAQETFEVLKNKQNGWLLTKIFIQTQTNSKRMIMATKIKKHFPKKELNTWFRVHRSWDHSEWTDLLQNLSNKVSMNCVPRLAGKMILDFILKLNDTQTTCKS